MPRIKGVPGPYRFFFTSFDCSEPPHVHVEREDKTCARELNCIRRLIAAHLETWYEHCASLR
ncbi:MAG: DUF4160 domain-containing protein [Acidobacteria bacterium]|nr:DUF4160 domain-containing protein [Acidobacteriota bacterium]